MGFRVKRVYDPPDNDDGYRVLIDRMWPRGMKKETAPFDEWLKDIAPSKELIRWFGHDPDKWPEFQKRYAAELDDVRGLLAPLIARAQKETVTLLYAARDTHHNNALVLERYLKRRLKK